MAIRSPFVTVTIDNRYNKPRTVSGIPLLWGTTVEIIAHTHMQVPCVVVDTYDGVEVIPLKKDGYIIKAKVS